MARAGFNKVAKQIICHAFRFRKCTRSAGNLYCYCIFNTGMNKERNEQTCGDRPRRREVLGAVDELRVNQVTNETTASMAVVR